MSQESFDDASIRIDSGGSSSSRCRDAVIKGPKAFTWSNELVRSDQPYADGQFHRPHNPPPNELGFVGGIGHNLGRRRSKVHPQRPTALQQIFGMRNQNMILHTFTQPIREQLCRPPDQRTEATRPMEAIVRDVTSADMIASSISQLATGSTVSSAHKPAQPVAPLQLTSLDHDADAGDDRSDTHIDGQPFYYSPAAIGERVSACVQLTQQSDAYAEYRLPVSDERVFRRWAQRLRVSDQQRQPQPTANEAGDQPSDASDGSPKRTGRSRQTMTTTTTSGKSVLSAGVDSYRTDGATSSVNMADTTPVAKAKTRNIFRKITGYLYGPFTRPVSADPMTRARDENKFGVPNAMAERAQRQEQRNAIEAEHLRRQRMENMGMRQPPGDDDDNDDDNDGDGDGVASTDDAANDSMQMVKRLALLRTPYFVVPTIRLDRVKRAGRYCNQFLRGDRLKRINLLLRDDGRPKSLSREAQQEQCEQRAKTVLAKLTTLRDRRKHAQRDTSGRNPEKAKYHAVIDSSYERQRALIEPDEEPAKPISFGQFRNIPDPMELQNLAIQLGTLDGRRSAAAAAAESDGSTDRAHSLRSRFVKSQPKKLFERSRNERLLRHLDNVDGPFYIDPNLMDKFRSPKKFKSPQKYYTNLIKGKHFIRDRLQVNGSSFDEEKIGVKDKKYFHRLITEYDEYYFHDLRNRPRVRKFCVKTDVQVIRDICRRNFEMYHMQESLIDMKAKQELESKYMDDVDQFQKVCLRGFTKWQHEAYAKVVAANQRLDELRRTNDKLRADQLQMVADSDLSNLRLYELEMRFKSQMKLQNYYYLFQTEEWRRQHDWIHRHADGRLHDPMTHFRQCLVYHIRPSSESSGVLIKEFYDIHIKPNLAKMLAVEPDAKAFADSLKTLNENAIKRVLTHKQLFWTFKGIVGMSKQLTQQINKSTDTKRMLIARLRQKAATLEETSRQMKVTATSLVDRGLTAAVKCPIERKVLAIADALHADLQRTEQLDGRQAAATPPQRFAQVVRHAQQLLGQLDEIPLDVLRATKTEMRAQRRVADERLADALSKQKRYELMRRQIENQFGRTAQFRRVQITVPRSKRRVAEGAKFANVV